MLNKGDCIVLENEKGNYCLINHYVTGEKERWYGCLIVGTVFRETPTLDQIRSAGALGYQHLQQETETIGTIVKWSKDLDDSNQYDKINYDILMIQEHVLTAASERLTKIGQIDLDPHFHPMPKFHSRQEDYERICELIDSRIKMKGSILELEKVLYETFPIAAILNQ